MSGIKLTEIEEDLRKQVQTNLEILRNDLNLQSLNSKERDKIYTEMASSAHKLHISLKERGFEPVHHQYMIKNRGIKADDPKFYDHIHPTEDLLEFLKDVNANKDPEDQTIGVDFTFNVYSRRWGHKDHYRLKRTSTGWGFNFNSYNGLCEKDGKPLLFTSLNHDSINYPEELPGYIEWVWQRASEDGLTRIQVQQALDELADWVSLCESNTPKGIFGNFK